jgi:hypothetical protein
MSGASSGFGYAAEMTVTIAVPGQPLESVVETKYVAGESIVILCVVSPVDHKKA